MKKIGLFYSFNTNKTAKIAERIKDALGDLAEPVNAENLTEEQFNAYDKFILGVPTWFDGELPNYWDEFVPALEDLDLKGKKFALYGLGDQKGYPQNFLDAVGIMAEILEARGGEIVGLTSIEGYEFEKSIALRDNKFLGLAIDFENQANLNSKRVKAWADQLKKEFGVK
jgi:flavodoxin I